MKRFLLISILLFAFVFDILVLNANANPYLDEDASEYSENDINAMFEPSADKRHSLYRRSCVKRGGICDYPIVLNDCCPNSACRCNLWGSNCRCQRMGLFQKWG